MIAFTSERVSDRRRDGVWPRVYRMRRGQRFLVGGLGLLLLLGGVAGSIALLLHDAGPSPWALAPLLLSVAGGYLGAAVRAERIVLHQDAFEIVELPKGSRRVRRDEIKGLRWVPLQYGQKKLVLERRTGKALGFGWVHETDAVLDAWLAAIPDLDREERARAEAELMRLPALGRDEAERLRSLKRARTIARLLTAASIAACAWGWFLPRPYEVAVATLAVLPLLGFGLLLVGRGRYAFEPSRTEPRPTLAVPLLGPGMVLGLRAVLDLHILDWRPLLAGAAAGGVALAAAIAAGDGKARRVWVLVFLAPLLSAYPWGVLSTANALLDRAEPEISRTRVLAKRVSRSKSTTYQLMLAPWGPVERPGSVDVARSLHEATAVGDPVCVTLHPGAFGVRWYQVRRCPG